ncbi:MAG: SLC13 family permease [Halobacteriales archaeon]
MALPPISTGAAIVFGLIFLALVLFVTEWIPTDITAVGIIVSLVIFEPWTGISGREAISGFASPATITIVAMYMLSAGIQKTGLVQRLGVYMARVTRGSETRVLAATVGSTGPIAGIINNTPVVAVFIPMISDLADASHISPSKLLLPLSYAAMLGGTLTLIGTSTNILASDLSRQLLDHPISMFEFTKLGVIILFVGGVYLMTIGRWLTPERIKPNTDLTEEFEVEDYLARVGVTDESPLIGQTVADVFEDTAFDLDVLQLVRGDETFFAPETDYTIESGDILTVRASTQEVNRIAETFALRQYPREDITDDELEDTESETVPIEAIIPPDSGFIDRSIDEVKFEERYRTTVLGVRRGDETVQTGLDDFTLEAGDALFLHTTPDAVDFFRETADLVVTQGLDSDVLEPIDRERSKLDPKTPIAVAIMGGVIGAAALDLVPIVIAALGGVVMMVVTRTLTTTEAYDAVSWSIIFLLAGVIPLGLAMQKTGGAEFIAALLVDSADVLPVIAVLGLFYLLTGLLANIITPVASVVLMIPIAVDTAARIGANGFAFLLAVMFAASTAFMTPVGYQTNLMVYGPGGYRFTDYLRVGGPLQALLTVVTTVGIAFFWGVT